jgi:hypothetical protein
MFACCGVFASGIHSNKGIRLNFIIKGYTSRPTAAAEQPVETSGKLKILVQELYLLHKFPNEILTYFKHTKFFRRKSEI